MTVRIRRADWSRDADSLLAIRYRVFVEEQGVPRELEHDSHDASALHLLALADDVTPIGTARLLIDGHIGRMAVLPAWRGRGVGSSLLLELLRIADASGSGAPFLNAQCDAIGFYTRLGFEPYGEVFDDAGIPHRRMRRAR